MRLRGRAIEAGINAFVQRLSVEVVKQVASLTPVDTGLARSNWILVVGQPVSTTKANPFTPYPKGSKANGQYTAERANLAAVIDVARFSVATRKPGNPVYIVNNLHYIGSLNSGTSTQAPANFVRLGVMNAVNIARRLLVRVIATRIT